MKAALIVLAVALALYAAPAFAGPPYLTDDPEPTDTGHWEFYVFAAGEGRGSVVEGDAGLDLNYGPVKGVQLTATLPLSFSHDRANGWRGGRGDVELGVKYRFYSNERSGVSAAIFPRVILPTSSLTRGGKTQLLLPVWLGKDIGRTSIFGGGGLLIDTAPGSRNVWQAALAVTHQLNDRVSLGAEVARQGPAERGATAQTRAGLGGIVKLTDHYALLLSAGPTFADRHTSYHAYIALGANF